MIAPVAVDGIIAEAAKVVEQIDHVAWVGRVAPQARKQLRLRLFSRDEHSGSGGNLLG